MQVLMMFKLYQIEVVVEMLTQISNGMKQLTSGHLAMMVLLTSTYQQAQQI